MFAHFSSDNPLSWFYLLYFSPQLQSVSCTNCVIEIGIVLNKICAVNMNEIYISSLCIFRINKIHIYDKNFPQSRPRVSNKPHRLVTFVVLDKKKYYMYLTLIFYVASLINAQCGCGS